MKFGGTSVANLERIRAAAELVLAEYQKGHSVCVVVSAMAGETNRLVSLVEGVDIHNKQLHIHPEYDAVVATGENVTAGLMALTLEALGLRARSWQGWQLAIHTNESFGRARIDRIDVMPVMKSLKLGIVAVVTGFQGVTTMLGEKRITTLGRGGSDTSAVALAAAISACRCDIYTDVDGVYTADPRMVKNAKKLSVIQHEEMLELASSGAKVLHLRSVELAMKHRVALQVRSSFVKSGNDDSGTMVVPDDIVDGDETNKRKIQFAKQNMTLEQRVVTGIVLDKDEVKITVYKIANKPGTAAAVFGALAEADINVDMIIQSGSHDKERNGYSDITFTVPRRELQRSIDILKSRQKEIDFKDIIFNDKVVKISVVGVGMRSHVGVAKTMFATLANSEINIDAISTSEIKISTLIAEDKAEAALNALHAAFELDQLAKENSQI